MKRIVLLVNVLFITLNSFAQSTTIDSNDTTFSAERRINGQVIISTGSPHQGRHRYCPYCNQPMNNNGFNGCDEAISGSAFNYELRKVKLQSTVAGRRVVAKRIASNYCLTSNQVYELVNAMMLTQAKLDLAKYCYTRCYDPENFEVVFNAFTTSEAVEDLNDYIVRNSRNNNGGWNNGNNGTNGGPNQGCERPMTASNFASAKQTILTGNFDDTRMQTAKTITTTNCLTTDQVIEICKLFSFESNKLEFAKFAYSRTYDKNNYFKVSNVFSYNNSKTELNEFIVAGGK